MPVKRARGCALALAAALALGACDADDDGGGRSPRAALPALEPFGAIEIGQDSGGARLAAAAAPAGVKALFRPEANRRWRLVVSGRPLEGTTTLRIRVGDGEPQWLPAPDGALHRPYTGGLPIEVVVYSDTPFAYQLERLALEDCPSCRLADDVRQEVLDGVPGLEKLVRDDPVEAAVRMLRWVAPRIDFALAPDLLLDEPVAGDVAAAYYEHFARDRKGVYCGGASVFFASLLRLFGLDAGTINFGVPGTDLTHVTVLLAVPAGQGPRFFLIDPTFSAVLRRRDDSVADLRTVLQFAAERRLRRLRLDEGPLAAREWLLPRDPVLRSQHPQVAGRCERVIDSGHEFDVCSHATFGMDRYVRLNQPALVRAGVPADEHVLIHLLRRHVFGIGPFAAPETRGALIDLLAGADVPLAPELQPGFAAP